MYGTNRKQERLSELSIVIMSNYQSTYAALPQRHPRRSALEAARRRQARAL